MLIISTGPARAGAGEGEEAAAGLVPGRADRGVVSPSGTP